MDRNKVGQCENHPFSEAVMFCGSSHPELAKAMAKEAKIPIGSLKRSKFPDGEISVEILESVRGKLAFVVQSIAKNPSEYLMEMLVIVDALKRASAKGIIAVIPYFGYCRQDRKDKPRVPITAKLVANLLEAAGVTRLVTMDLHAEQVQGFFDIPVDHLFAKKPLIEAFLKEISKSRKEGFKPEEFVVVAPDVGSVKIAKSTAEILGSDFAVADKLRVDSIKKSRSLSKDFTSNVEVRQLIGDVKEKNVLLADDICSTGSTIASAAKACQEKGARKIFALVTHGLFVGEALEMIKRSGVEAIFVTDTIPHEQNVKEDQFLHIIPVARLFGLALQCTLLNKSISSLQESHL